MLDDRAGLGLVRSHFATYNVTLISVELEPRAMTASPGGRFNFRVPTRVAPNTTPGALSGVEARNRRSVLTHSERDSGRARAQVI